MSSMVFGELAKPSVIVARINSGEKLIRVYCLKLYILQPHLMGTMTIIFLIKLLD